MTSERWALLNPPPSVLQMSECDIAVINVVLHLHFNCSASGCIVRGNLMTAAKISCTVVMILAKVTITMTTPVTPILFLMGGLSESEVGGV